MVRDCKNWPEQRDITNNNEFKKERKMVNELPTATVDLQNLIDTLLKKLTLRKMLRILNWINCFNCFLNNCRKSKVSDLLTADKVLIQRRS